MIKLDEVLLKVIRAADPNKLSITKDEINKSISIFKVKH